MHEPTVQPPAPPHRALSDPHTVLSDAQSDQITLAKPMSHSLSTPNPGKHIMVAICSINGGVIIAWCEPSIKYME